MRRASRKPTAQREPPEEVLVAVCLACGALAAVGRIRQRFGSSCPECPAGALWIRFYRYAQVHSTRDLVVQGSS